MTDDLSCDKPTFVITELRLFPKSNKPCIYMWARGEEVLYIGSTTQIHKRLVGHNIINRLTFKDGDIILVFEIPNLGVNYLKRVERSLIADVRPKHNIRDNNKVEKLRKIGDKLLEIKRGELWLADHV